MDANLQRSVNSIPELSPTENVEKKIIMFGSPTCSDCTRIKKFFREKMGFFPHVSIYSTPGVGVVWVFEIVLGFIKISAGVNTFPPQGWKLLK